MPANGTKTAEDVVIKKAYIDSPEGQIHYHFSLPSTLSNSVTTPIFMLHMSASSSSCFKDLMCTLSSIGYSCIAPDMPGFGGSFDPVTDPPSISWYAELYHNVFSKFPNFDRGCHIIGHHSGGVIGTELAAKYQGFCQTLTMIGPTVMTAEERSEMSKTFLLPFNEPVSSGEHLLKTWKYLIWEGIREDNLPLLQREVLDHVRAWKGRSQIYSCVWAYDCSEGMNRINDDCKILGLCAKDDVLWPYFKQFQTARKGLTAREIMGGNFGPDLDVQGVLREFLSFISHN